MPTDIGGTLTSPGIIKFMAVCMMLFCIIVDYLVLIQNAWRPTSFYPGILVFLSLFVVWPLAAVVWVSWAWFTDVEFSPSGIKANTGWGTKHSFRWDEVVAVQYYHRIGARRFALVYGNRRVLSIDTDKVFFLDFLTYVREHLPAHIEKESRLAIESARESIRSSFGSSGQ